ncbi:hypothetical protein FQA39_LY13549 [Lamprigera yunnana]|nr:hypothetical protein FQA39_LY13549 [Lamprigera yunnana]
MIWKPRQIGSKTLTFEMIEEKKILRIEDVCGNEVYLGWESVSKVWSLQTVLSYRLSYSSEQRCIKTIDLKSAVEHLYEKLGALEFDADHEAIYGMEKYYTLEQCEELRDKYKIGRKEYRQFLKGKYCSQCLKDRLSKIGLQYFLDAINKYISNSDTSNEEEYKAVEQMKNQRKSKGERMTKPVS